MPIWQLCANLLIPNCLRSNLSYSPLATLELYVKCYKPVLYRFNPPLQQAEWQAFAWKIPVFLTKSSDVFDEKLGCF